MAYKVDFAELKQRFPIEKVAELLGLETRKAAPGLRAPCSACGTGGDRALAINTKDNIFYCWAEHKGGDAIQLIAHTQGVEVKQAAEWLVGTVPSKKEMPGTSIPTGNGFQPLDYLDPEHDAVAALGFSASDAAALGVGYAPRGTMKGHVLIPVRLPTGDLAGYVGVTDAILPSEWHGLPDPKITPFPKRA